MPIARPRSRRVNAQSHTAATQARQAQQAAAMRAKGIERTPTPAKGVLRPPVIPGGAPMVPTPAGVPVAAPAAGPGAPAPPPGPVNPFATQTGDSATTIAGVGQANQNYNDAVARGTAAKSELLRRYGVSEYADPATGRKYRLDIEGNPYSEGAKIALDFKNQRQGDNTSFANGGMLYDGSYGQQMNATNFREGAAYEGLFNAVTDGVGQIEQGTQQAYQDAMGIVLGLRGDDTERAASTITPGQGAPPPLTPAQGTAKTAHKSAKSTTTNAAKQAEAAAKAKAKKKGKG